MEELKENIDEVINFFKKIFIRLIIALFLNTYMSKPKGWLIQEFPTPATAASNWLRL